MMESDLYIVLEKYYRKLGYDVQGEVCGCDLVAVKGEKVIIIELKKSFNVKLLYQATRRLSATEFVYIAFFKPQARQAMSFWTMVKSLCRRLNIGAIVIDSENVKFLSEPGIFSAKKSNIQRASILKEFNGRKASRNIGGVTGKKLETAYLESAVQIAVILSDNEARSAKKLQELGTSDKTYSILYQNHYGWFEKKEKGLYGIKKNSLKLIREKYPEIWLYYLKNK
ncbi:MAG: DUF2161 family putative PD-(D/E)XK-type phosphodiesterase [Spirochaetia bacterium]|nr:DUF2161 family putative PD-(D/E)XK-type phosphodiesterase [Spirochaetia bacterium]